MISGSQKALMQCRSGIARSGATRSDYYYANLACTIGGVDRAAKIWKGTTKISGLLNEQPDEATLDVYGFDPVVGQEIVIGSGAINNRVFGGTILSAQQQSIRKQGLKRYTLTCQDYTWLLNRRTVTKRYPAQAAHLIVIDLISNGASGFTTNNVQVGSPTTPDVLDFHAQTLSAAITQVADLVGWYWYVDYNKDIHFFLTETSQAPKDLTDTNYAYDQLTWTPVIDNIRTRVLIEGGGCQTTAPVAVSATTIPVQECGWFDASLYSGGIGTVVTNGQVIQYTGRSATSGAGNLTGVPAGGAGSVLYAIKQSDPINIWVQVDDAAAQAALAALEGGDGIHEHPYRNTSFTISASQANGLAQLALFKGIDYQGTYWTRDKFTGVGKQLNVNSVNRGISNVKVTLQKVTRSFLGKGVWQFKAEFATIRNDLNNVLRELQRRRSA